MIYDIAIIGGGIVGLATALALTEAGVQSLIVLEAEPQVAAHQTGHNSGVIHSGLYYKPGSYKATLCTEGRERLYAFCDEHSIAHDRCGKLVVATSDDEVSRLAALEERGRANGLAVTRLRGEELRNYEPHVAGMAGLWVPETGIVDYTQVTQAYAHAVQANGGIVRTGWKLTGCRRMPQKILLESPQGEVACRNVIACAGLQADRVAKMCGVDPDVRIVPFRGEYFALAPARRSLVKNLIYPVPDPQFPFLGVHYTRKIGGGVEAGPNAVLALRRDGYGKFSFSVRDTWNMATYPGAWRLARRYWRMGSGELWRSLSKYAFWRALRRLTPDIDVEDLLPAGAGVRAQALARDGRLVDDFHVVSGYRMLHVINAPSPAATASLSIGRYLAQQATTQFELKRQSSAPASHQ